jgi:serine/threonine protein kinase
MSISAENLCVLKKGSNITLKITDFGSAKRETEPPDFMGCTVEYLSPELKKKRKTKQNKTYRYKDGLSKPDS